MDDLHLWDWGELQAEVTRLRLANQRLREERDLWKKAFERLQDRHESALTDMAALTASRSRSE